MENDENSFELVENREAIELVPTWELHWWWLLVAAGAVLLLVVLIRFLRRKKVRSDPSRAKREAYRKSIEAFGGIEANGAGRDVAVRVSVILRAYLAESLGEPSLYETHEEFIGRHDALAELSDDTKEATADFFAELAALKYGPEKPGNEVSGNLKERGRVLLERIHAA